MPGFGPGSWGPSPWGIGAPAAAFAVDHALAIDGNTVRITYTDNPQTVHDRLTTDGLNPRNYAITILAGPNAAWSPRVAHVYPVDGDPLSLDLRLDQTMPGKMMSQQTQFRVTVTNVMSAAGAMLVGAPYAAFWSLNQMVMETTVRLDRAAGRDLSRPWTPNSPAGGTFRIGSSGDYRFDSGLTLVKKLIYRRILTVKGGFFHLPNYGMGLKPKAVAYPYQLTSARAEMRRQILEESEVQDCTVKVTQTAQGIVIFFVKVRTKQGLEDDLKFTVQPNGSVVPG